jgi:hypothetical protein
MGGAERPADAAERRLDGLSVGRWLDSGELVRVSDGRAAPADGRGLPPGFRLGGQEAGDGLRRCRKRGNASAAAPPLKGGKVALVSSARGRRFVLAREVGGAVEVGGRQGGQRRGLLDDGESGGHVEGSNYVREKDF